MTEQQRKNLSKGKRICEESAREYQKKSSEAQIRNHKEEIVLAKLIAKRMGFDDATEMVDNLIARAKDSDSSFAMLRDTIGQKPTDKQEVTANVSMTVEDYFNQIDDGWDEA